MDWLKLSSNGILRGSLSQSKDIVQLVWIKLLALMNETHFRNGRFEYASGKPYSLDMIAINCGTTKEILEGCLCEYEEDINPDDGLPRIQCDTDGTLVITNWAKYQNKPEKPKEKPPMSDEQLDALNIQRQVKKPELTVKGATLQNKAVLDIPTGEIQQDQAILDKQAEIKTQNDAIGELKDRADIKE